MKKLGVINLPTRRDKRIFNAYSLEQICETLAAYVNGDISICPPGEWPRKRPKKTKKKKPEKVSLQPREKSKYPKGYALMETKTMQLDDILIRDGMANGNPPRESKYQKRLVFYKKHGHVYKTIQINADGILLDGYISYLILKEHGVSECTVEVLTHILLEM